MKTTAKRKRRKTTKEGSRQRSVSSGKIMALVIKVLLATSLMAKERSAFQPLTASSEQSGASSNYAKSQTVLMLTQTAKKDAELTRWTIKLSRKLWHGSRSSIRVLQTNSKKTSRDLLLMKAGKKSRWTPDTKTRFVKNGKANSARLCFVLKLMAKSILDCSRLNLLNSELKYATGQTKERNAPH